MEICRGLLFSVRLFQLFIPGMAQLGWKASFNKLDFKKILSEIWVCNIPVF